MRSLLSVSARALCSEQNEHQGGSSPMLGIRATGLVVCLDTSSVFLIRKTAASMHWGLLLMLLCPVRWSGLRGRHLTYHGHVGKSVRSELGPDEAQRPAPGCSSVVHSLIAGTMPVRSHLCAQASHEVVSSSVVRALLILSPNLYLPAGLCRAGGDLDRIIYKEC